MPRILLKDRRIELGFTQQEVANMAGIDRSTYTNIELGNKNPSFPLVLKIKEALKVNDDKIFLNYECQKGTTSFDSEHSKMSSQAS